MVSGISRVLYSGGGGIYPRHEFDMGGIFPHQLDFLGNSFSGFENLITLANFKWNFKAFRSRIKHFKVLKTHQWGYFHFKKKHFFLFSPPLIFF
jgi:hypothetical protein